MFGKRIESVDHCGSFSFIFCLFAWFLCRCCLCSHSKLWYVCCVFVFVVVFVCVYACVSRSSMNAFSSGASRVNLCVSHGASVFCVAVPFLFLLDDMTHLASASCRCLTKMSLRHCDALMHELSLRPSLVEMCPAHCAASLVSASPEQWSSALCTCNFADVARWSDLQNLEPKRAAP